MITSLYTIGFGLVWLYFGLGYTVEVYIVSLLIALIPLATSRFLFALPILIVLYSFIFGDSTFAWLCLIFSPFHWVAFAGLMVDAIKGIFDID